MARGWFGSLRTSSPRDDADAAQAKLVWMLVLATLPTLVAGFLGKEFVEQNLRSTVVIASTTILFALLLGVAEWRSKQLRQTVKLGFGIALLVGFAQVLALVPGTSRSGVTITAAVLLGLSRREAANFSFLLSIPIIAAAGVLLALDVRDLPQAADLLPLALAVLVSGLSAWACIALFLRLIERIGLMPFVWYRLVLGSVLFWMIARQA